MTISSPRDEVADQLGANVKHAQRFARLLDALLAGVDPAEGLDPTLAAVLADLDPDPDAFDDADLASVLVNSAVLEVYGWARVDHHGIDTREVVMVTGTGGPHIEIRIRFDGETTARGYWGNRKDRMHAGTLEHLADYAGDLIGGWDQDREGAGR